MPTILSGDIGGTKTQIGLFESKQNGLRKIFSESYPSQEYPSLETIVEKFLSSRRIHVQDACFGVAGPVINGRSRITNLPWLIDSRSLARKLHIPRAGLINDLEANGWGIGALSSKDFAVVHPGKKQAGNACVISPGTGLGEAGLYWDGQKHVPFASEGGHSSFAPQNDLEVELARYLASRFGHVSVERVISGPGLHNIYKFLRDTGRGEEPAWLTDELTNGDPSAVISRVALEARSALCEQALDIFVRNCGAEAGNLALKFMAVGGVYLGGGIAPKIADKLKEKQFQEAFVSKGRMRPLLERIRIQIILNPLAALWGAARWTIENRQAVRSHVRRGQVNGRPTSAKPHRQPSRRR
jgi:glucokinase